MLFRFSALTWNAHKIHYDHTYAQQEEGSFSSLPSALICVPSLPSGYPAPLVHGPLSCTLLLDLLRRSRPDTDSTLSAFEYKSMPGCLLHTVRNSVVPSRGTTGGRKPNHPPCGVAANVVEVLTTSVNMSLSLFV